MPKPIVYTKDSLITKLKQISKMGFILNHRYNNHGSIGNTLEDLLDIKENNLPIPNAAEWELKTQRTNTTSLTTLFHSEPSPRALKFVPQILLPLYGWKHAEAGNTYSENELSFRQTIHGHNYSDRGFIVKIDRSERKVLISFDAKKVSIKHEKWLESVKKRVGNLEQLDPQPYWGFDDLEHKAGTKLLNCFYVKADIKKINNEYYYHYSSITMLQKFNFEGFLKALEEAKILVDFDARTGHNHGTKFRMRQNCLPSLYEKSTVII